MAGWHITSKSNTHKDGLITSSCFSCLYCWVSLTIFCWQLLRYEYQLISIEVSVIISNCFYCLKNRVWGRLIRVLDFEGNRDWFIKTWFFITLLLSKKLSNINSWSEIDIKIWNNIINGLWKTKKMATSTLRLKDIFRFRYEHPSKCKKS